ncbi:MAG: NAD-dependent epimerase/dehydratase family protein, partial [Thermaurantiacus sp.]
NLEQPESLKRLVAGADAIVHIAGVTNARDRRGFEAGNIFGTAAVRAVADTIPLLHISSLAAREPGLSIYGETKKLGEDVARGTAGPLAILRPPAVYGPGDTEFLPMFRAALRGVVPIPAHGVAAMIFVTDLARAILALAEDLAGEARCSGGTFEIDDGAGGHSQAKIAAAIGAAIGREVRALPVPRPLITAGALLDTLVSRMAGQLPSLSIDRARYLPHPDWSADSGPLRALGLWEPSTDLAEGMAETARWYRRQGMLPPLR